LTEKNTSSQLERRLLALRYRLRLDPGAPNTFGSEGSFEPPIGANWEPGGQVRGYYIDFRLKPESPEWPPFWLGPVEGQFHVTAAQWGLGAFERYLDGEGEEWLRAARQAAQHLVDIQERGGARDGGWIHRVPMPHTFRLDPPWLSAMAQGEGASLLTRLHLETGEDRFAEAALRALKTMDLPVAAGGTMAELDGQPFLEEYPTEIPSCVLNGAIFAIWGYYDAGHGLDDADAKASFERTTTALAELISRFDTGYWSRYDLYPHPTRNVATPAYHLLHIRQLTALNDLSPRPQLKPAIERFDAYRGRRANRARATAAKVAFRLQVPRNPVLAQRLPKRAPKEDTGAAATPSDVLVLCYHAVSPTWPADLSIAPELLREQLRHLAGRGYRGVTFSEAVAGAGGGKLVAVTFDDGYRSVLELALPILAGLGMPGTLFVPTDYIGSEQPMSWPGIEQWTGGEHERELIPMSWPEVERLREAGWEIGSHTSSHPKLTQLSPEQLAAELGDSRRECEQMLGDCASIAYPYGDHDEAVVAAAAAAGYSAAATLPDDVPPATSLAWPRIGIYNNDDMRAFRLKVSPAVRRARGSSAWPLLAGGLRSLKRRMAG
jgi:heparosan-N-sulfate-glucuronate 5-epimerase